MNNNAKPMKIRFPASSAVLEPDKDELLSATDSGDLRVETRRAPCGVEYVVERDAKEERRRAAAALGAESAARAGSIGGRSTSEAKLAAIAKNREKSDGRAPTTPDGIARLPLRKALEGIFGKPLPKEGPVAKLVHKMSSAAVVRRAWPLVEPTVPEDRRAEIGALVEKLAATLESLRAASRVETFRIDGNGRLVDSDGQPVSV
jgi:hypothetical protein